MRFESIALRGLGPFASEVNVDLMGIEGKLIAITGANGEGKSTLLELLPGALFRQTPNRGSLAGLATSRDAYVEVEVVNGARYRIRQTVDGISGKGESLILDGEGKPVLTSGKVTEYDFWARNHLVSPEVMYASTFAPQGSGGFLDLKESDRKAVLLRVLGVEKLEKLAQSARDKARAEKVRLEVLVARMADVSGLSEAEASTNLEIDRVHLAQANCDLMGAEKAYRDAEAAVQGFLKIADREITLAMADETAANAKATEAENASERAKAAKERLAGLQARFADLQKRIKANQELLSKADAVRSAVARDATIVEELQALQAQAAELRVEVQKAEGEVRLATSKRDSAIRRAKEAKERAAKAEARLENREAIEAAVLSILPMKQTVERTQEYVEKANLWLEELQGKRVTGAEGRIVGLREGLGAIAAGVSEPAQIIAHRVLNEDDATIELASSLPGQIAASKREAAECQHRLDVAKSALAGAERLAAQASDLSRADAEIEAAKEEILLAASEIETADVSIWELSSFASQKQEELATVEGKAAELAKERANLASNVGLAPHLAVAETKISERASQIKATTWDILTAENETKAAESEADTARHAWLQAKDMASKRRALVTEHQANAAKAQPSKGKVEEASLHVKTAEKQVTIAEGELARAVANSEKVKDLGEQRSAVQADLADWERLSQDLGRDGLQALEIDAAGGELTELVNDLLHTCVGPRWTVSVETTRLSSDGKKTLEDCAVNILDSECGVDPSKYIPSGGQHVLVGEAISLALSMLACRRAGVEGPTIVRDETGAALDPANAAAYVAMLRRAADIVGASHVLFVSHNPDVQAMADARIVVAGGKVTVEA